MKSRLAFKYGVTMRAVLPAGADPVSSYRWQEGSSGKWTDMSSTKVHQSATSTTSGARVFRVVASYGSLGSASSLPVMVVWRPLGVVVSSSPAYPESGDAAKRTVTLTASSTAPTGATYQWQQWSNGGWTNLGTVSTSTVKSVSYSSRGTRKFRVSVALGGVSLGQSAPVYVTWDEWAIVSDLLTALSSAVASSTAYTTSQTGLLSCMNATSTPSGTGVKTSFTSFEDILSRYSGATRSKMEGSGACSSQATTMFNTLESVSRSELSGLKAGSAEYAGLLATDFGKYLEANVGDAETLRLDAVLASSAATSTPGSLEQPYYASSGAGGTGITPPPTIDPALKAGLGCLPKGVDGSRLTLRNKLLVLNCLIFSTPHSFWIKEDDGVREAEALRTDARWSWIGTGDWECSFSPDGPLPSCLKHDVTYSSLKKFAGGNDTGLDEAWNPRNKALSDMKFRADIRLHGCEDSTRFKDIPVCPPTLVPSYPLGEVYYFGVAWVYSLFWTYTDYDFKHIQSYHRFVEYHIPRVRNVKVSKLPSPLVGLENYEVSWTYDPGTVNVATVSRYRLCWERWEGSIMCSTLSPNDLDATNGILRYDLLVLGGLQSLKSIAISPNNKRIRGVGGMFYPPQFLNLKF